MFVAGARAFLRPGESSKQKHKNKKNNVFGKKRQKWAVSEPFLTTVCSETLFLPDFWKKERFAGYCRQKWAVAEPCLTTVCSETLLLPKTLSFCCWGGGGELSPGPKKNLSPKAWPVGPPGWVWARQCRVHGKFWPRQLPGGLAGRLPGNLLGMFPGYCVPYTAHCILYTVLYTVWGIMYSV